MAKPFSTALALRELATPTGNPPAGTRWFYIKSDGFLYTKNSSGVEAVVAGGGGGGASTLDGLTDVDAPTPLTGQVLTFDGTAWVPDDIDAAKTSSIYGYGGSTTAKNAASPALIDLDYLGPQDYVSLPGGNSSRVDASPDFVPQGDVDIRVKMTHPLWRAWGGGTEAIFGQWTTVNRYILWLQSDGTIRVIANDSANVRHDQSIGYALTAAFKPGETGWIRVTIDINNGAGAAQYTLYTSSDGTTWTQRGIANASAGVIPGWLTAAGTPQIGVYNNSTAPTRARVHRLQVLDGVDGPLLADFNATDFPDKASASVSPTVIDSTGRSWTLQGDAKAHTRKALWLPGTTGNYVSTPDKNELDYESSTFETSVGTWEGINKNLLTANQSSAETDTTGWANVANATLTRTTAQALQGSASFSVAAVAAADTAIHTGSYGVPNGTTITHPAVLPNQVYTISAWVKAATVSRVFRIDYAFMDSTGANLGYVSNPMSTASQTGGWTQHTFTIRAPATAAYLRLIPYWLGCAAGEVHYIDALSVMETPNANLINNSDFENGTNGWTGGLTRSVEQAYTGTASLKGTRTGGALVLGSNSASSMRLSGTVTISAWIYLTVGMTVGINLYRSPGGAGDDLGRVNADPSKLNQWQRVTTTYTGVADNPDWYMRVYSDSGIDGSFYFDAPQVVLGSTALPYLPPTTTNLCPNPSFEVDLTGWSPTRGTAVRVTTESSVGNASLEYTSNDTSGGNYVHNSPRVSIIGGRIYTVSAYMKGDGGAAQAAQITCYYYDATGAQVGGADTGTATNLTTSWSRRSVIAMPPSTAATMDVYLIFGNNFAVGRKAWVDAVQIEYGSVTTPYVDGSLGAAGYAYAALGAGYSWDSTANLMTGSNPDFATDATGWAYNTSAGSGVTTRVATGGPSGGPSTYGSFTKPADASSWNYISKALPTAARLPAGSMLTISFWARHGAGQGADKWVTPSLADGTGLNTTWSGSTFLLTSSWQRFTFSAITGTASNAGNVLYLAPSTGSEAKEIHITGVQFETLPFSTPYGQTGVANASTSTRRHFWVAGGSSVDLIGRTQNIGGREGTYEAIVGSGAAKYQTINGYQGSSYGAQTGWISASASTAYSLSLMVWVETNAEFQVIDQAGSLLASSSASSTYWSSSSRFSLAFTTLATTTSVRIRALVKTGGSGYVYIDAVQLEKAATATAYVPPLRITGDLDVRAKVAMVDWTPAQEAPLINRYGMTVGAIHFSVLPSGIIRFGWNNTTAWTPRDSTVATGLTDGAVKWVRATLDVDNGAGGHDVKFYLSDDGVTWTQLGSTVTTAGTTQVSQGAGEELHIGRNNAGPSELFKGSVLAAQVRSGIDGPIVAEMRPEEAAEASSSWTDATDRTWTVNRSGDATAEIVARNTWAFTGSEYLTLPDRSELDFGSGEFTIVTSLARRMHSSANRILAGKLTYLGGSNAGYALTLLFNELTPKMSISDGTSSVQATAPAALTPGAWTVVAGDRQADDKARAYVGGVVGSPSSSLVGSTDNALPFRVNAYGDTPYGNYGLSNWTAVFRRTLTTAEHAELAAWDGRVATQPDWLDGAATLLVNADEPGTRAAYRAANFVGSHFTGDTPDDADYIYYWSGTPYASESIRVPASYARAIVPVQPDEPPNMVTGALWYDSDLELDDPEVYVQSNEPLGTPEGTLWYDTDEVAEQPIDGSTGIIDGTVTEPKLSTAVQAKINAVPDPVSVQIEAGDKGDWSATSAYVKGDVVQYQGKAWVATAAVAAPTITGNDPTLTGKVIGATPSASAIAVVIPATVAVGDEMLVVVSNYNTAWTTTSISGGSAGAWTVLAANQSAASTYTTYSTLLRKTAAAGDPGATLTVSGLNSSYCSVDFRAYRYATYDKYVFTAQNGTASPIPTPALTTTAGRGVTVHAVASMTNTSASPSITVDTKLSNTQAAVSPSYFDAGSGDELRTAASGGTPNRFFTVHSAGGFATWAVSLIGTRTVDGNTFNTSVWQELPFAPRAGRWELVQAITPTGTSNVATNCRFTVPTKYRKFKIECDGVNVGLATSGHLYMTFNNTTTLAYYCVMEYRSTGAWSQTSAGSATFGYIGYNYLYTGPGRRNRFRLEVQNDTLTQPLFESQVWSLNQAGSYVYAMQGSGVWNATAKITSVEIFTSVASFWNCDQPIYLYGWVD